MLPLPKKSSLPCLARLITGLIFLLLAVYAIAEPLTTPDRLAVAGTTQITEDKIPFDWTKAEVKLVGGRWKIVVGTMLMLDFNTNEAQAQQALRVIQYYHLSEQCFVGRPNPPMQYFLVNGGAPTIAMPGEDNISFNLATVAAKQINGSWKVVDGNNWLLDFGAHQDQAQQALAIIKKYSFTNICFVGRPNPPMMYFRSGPAQYQEDKIAFDWTKAQVQQIGGRWKVTVGNTWMLDFNTNEMQARQALETIQYYHMNAQCFVGRPNPPMQYYLTDNKAPNAPMPGEDTIAFNPAKLVVQQVNGSWKVVETPNHWMLDFGANEIQARQALALILKYGFTSICFVGRPGTPMMYFRTGAAKYQEDQIAFDWTKAQAQQIGGRWKVTVGNMWMLDFNTNEAQARQALKVIQTYHLNAQCFVGRPNPPMQYYLANAASPAGALAGEDKISFDPTKLMVQQVNGSWKVIESPNHWMLDFGANEMQARQSLALIREYGFTNICFVGRPNPPMTYFRK